MLCGKGHTCLGHHRTIGTIRTILPYTSKPATIRTFVPSSTTNHITCTLSHVPCTAPQHSVKGQSSSRMIRVTVLWSARVCCRWRDQAGKGPRLMVTYVRPTYTYMYMYTYTYVRPPYSPPFPEHATMVTRWNLTSDRQREERI